MNNVHSQGIRASLGEFTFNCDKDMGPKKQRGKRGGQANGTGSGTNNTETPLTPGDLIVPSSPAPNEAPDKRVPVDSEREYGIHIDRMQSEGGGSQRMSPASPEGNQEDLREAIRQEFNTDPSEETPVLSTTHAVEQLLKGRARGEDLHLPEEEAKMTAEQKTERSRAKEAAEAEAKRAEVGDGPLPEQLEQHTDYPEAVELGPGAERYERESGARSPPKESTASGDPHNSKQDGAHFASPQAIPRTKTPPPTPVTGSTSPAHQGQNEGKLNTFHSATEEHRGPLKKGISLVDIKDPDIRRIVRQETIDSIPKLTNVPLSGSGNLHERGDSAELLGFGARSDNYTSTNFGVAYSGVSNRATMDVGSPERLHTASEGSSSGQSSVTSVDRSPKVTDAKKATKRKQSPQSVQEEDQMGSPKKILRKDESSDEMEEPNPSNSKRPALGTSEVSKLKLGKLPAEGSDRGGQDPPASLSDRGNLDLPQKSEDRIRSQSPRRLHVDVPRGAERKSRLGGLRWEALGDEVMPPLVQSGMKKYQRLKWPISIVHEGWVRLPPAKSLETPVHPSPHIHNFSGRTTALHPR